MVVTGLAGALFGKLSSSSSGPLSTWFVVANKNMFVPVSHVLYSLLITLAIPRYFALYCCSSIAYECAISWCSFNPIQRFLFHLMSRVFVRGIRSHLAGKVTFSGSHFQWVHSCLAGTFRSNGSVALHGSVFVLLLRWRAMFVLKSSRVSICL